MNDLLSANLRHNILQYYNLADKQKEKLWMNEKYDYAKIIGIG